jgi:hypothetical protein
LERKVYLLLVFVELTVTGLQKSQCYRINAAVAGRSYKCAFNKGVTSHFHESIGRDFPKILPRRCKYPKDWSRRNYVKDKISVVNDSTSTEDVNCGTSPPPEAAAVAAAERSKE